MSLSTSTDEISADRIASPRLAGNREDEPQPGLTAPSGSDQSCSAISRKRKVESEIPEIVDCSDPKKRKVDEGLRAHHLSLSSAPTEAFSLFVHEDFRDHLCRCAECHPLLRAHPQLLEEEVSYEPPLSQDGDGDGESMGTGSLLDRGEAALSNVDRVRAIGKSIFRVSSANLPFTYSQQY